MAESTRDIKRRIKGIGNIRQITKAMELVSSAKLRKARLRLEKSRPYYTTVLENIQRVLASTGNMNHPLLKSREVENSLYIIISSDRGLAGGYNANVIRLVELAMRDKKDKVSLIVVGIRAREYFKRRGYKVVKDYAGISEEPEFSDARMIGRLAMRLFRDGEVDEINVVFTRFMGTLSFEPRILKLLPSEEVSQKSEEEGLVIEFEPSADEVLNYLIPKYIESSIYGALIEASCSEQGARRAAMESATDNAEEIIDELKISYNRARQAAITSEISEIVSGAEAIK